MIRFICLAIIGLTMLIPPAHAEETIEFTQCLSGTFTLFHQSKEVPLVCSWAESGITMSDDKRFNNMTIHCEGVQMGIGPKRKGYYLCKATDLDGDMIIYGGPYAAPGSGSGAKIELGTGKWKGIKGTFNRKRIVRSKPRKGAMPGTYQGCHKVKVTFELPYALPKTKPEDVGLSSEKLKELGAFIAKSVEEERIPGAVVLVARYGKIAYLENFGMRDVAKKAAMETDSIFRIYSMTKPIVCVAVLMLMEEGKISLNDPISKYIPELGGLKVGVEGPDGEFKTVPSKRDMTILDLLRHTSGLTYGVFFKSKVKSLYKEAGIHSWNQTAEEMVTKLGKLPLAYEPGTRWEYSRSTDVLGRLIEILSGMPLDKFLEKKIIKPLKMVDTGFYVKPEKLNRLAQPGHPRLRDVSTPPKLLSGGGGMVSTVGDYARFAQMLINGGELDGVRILKKETVALMIKDHLGPLGNRSDPKYFPGPFAGFGLGVAVFNKPKGLIQPGTFYWIGWGGTVFAVNPNKKLIRILMFQNPDFATKRYMWRPFADYVEGAVTD